MLASIDVLIGLSLVMLIGSLAAMLLTQAMLATVRSRGRHLARGLTDLLTQLHPGTSADDASAIADAVLMHPLVRGSERRRGTVVKREELLKLLMELGDPTLDPAKAPSLTDSAKRALTNILEENGVHDPAATLRNVRLAAMELERTFPELSTAARHTLALTQEARSELVAKVNAWFDQTMDRVTERFTYSSRAFTFVAAALIVIVTQLDTVLVLNRLSMDENMRRAFVEQAVRIDQQRQANAGTGEQGTVADEQLFNFVSEAGVVRVPESYEVWKNRWKSTNPAGIVLSIVLLSLGAPFWFNILSNLIRLRSVVAQKDDIDRTQRQLDTTASTSAPSAVANTASRSVVGERGDLAAVG